VADAIARGAQVALGGDLHALGGNFYQPTILTDDPVAGLERANKQAAELANVHGRI